MRAGGLSEIPEDVPPGAQVGRRSRVLIDDTP
jgi:hypothetical protein